MASKRTELELLGEINEKLDKIIGLSAIQGISNERKVEVLSELGFKSGFISSLVGMTPGAVRTAMSRKRISKAKKFKKAK